MAIWAAALVSTTEIYKLCPVTMGKETGRIRIENATVQAPLTASRMQKSRGLLAEIQRQDVPASRQELQLGLMEIELRVGNTAWDKGKLHC